MLEGDLEGGKEREKGGGGNPMPHAESDDTAPSRPNSDDPHDAGIGRTTPTTRGL